MFRLVVLQLYVWSILEFEISLLRWRLSTTRNIAFVRVGRSTAVVALPTSRVSRLPDLGLPKCSVPHSSNGYCKLLCACEKAKCAYHAVYSLARRTQQHSSNTTAATQQAVGQTRPHQNLDCTCILVEKQLPKIAPRF